MEFKFITGKMGTGKTELARAISRNKGRRWNVFELEDGCKLNFEEYLGEECIILDGVKACSELLPKFIELNNNNDIIQFLTCKMIIITSCLDIDDFCKEVFKDDELLINQFKNLCLYRIKTSFCDF